MKTIVTSIILALVSYSLTAQNLTVTVENIKAEGTMYVGIFQSQEDFNTKKVAAGDVVEVKANESEMTFEYDLPEGTYGVAVYIDTENGNFSGPNYGPYGFSNAYVPNSYPIFEQFKFELSGKHEEKIVLQ